MLEGRSQNINSRRRSYSELMFVSVRLHVLISDNLPVRKNISILILYRMKMHDIATFSYGISPQLFPLIGLNIFISYYNYTSIHIYMKIIQAMGLERKLKAYKVLLPYMKYLHKLWRIPVYSKNWYNVKRNLTVHSMWGRKKKENKANLI